MSDYTYLVPGFIPTDCISSPGELDQMVADAQPVSNVSFNYYSATAPDIITYPALVRCIWVDTHTTPYVKRLYNAGTSSWVLEVPADGSITGAMIADGTIPLTKLKASLYGANTVAQVNSTSTAWLAVPANTLFSPSYRLDINSISLSGVGAYVFSSNGSTNTWATFASYLTAGVVPLTAISTTGAADPSVLSYVGGTLDYRDVTTTIVDNTVAITKLVSGPANTILGMDSTGAVKTWLTAAQIYALISPYTAANSYVTATGNQQAIPAAGSSNTFPHGLVATPPAYGASIICTSADLTYAVGTRIEVSSLYRAGGTACASVRVDATNVYVDWGSVDPATIAGVLTIAKWQVTSWAVKL